MTFHLKIYASRFGQQFYDVIVTNDMKSKDVIPLLHLQSNLELENHYGLMVESYQKGSCHWVPSDMTFDSTILDQQDRIFISPLKKILEICLPRDSNQKTLMNVSLIDSTRSVVAECCKEFHIHPHEVWGAFIHARNELIMLNNDQSIAEQTQKVDKIFLRQYIFPITRSSKYFSPLPLYLIQYRKMAINGEFCTLPEDREVLQKFIWYTSKNPCLKESKTIKEQEQEFHNFMELKSFGELNYTVRIRFVDIVKKESTKDEICTFTITNKSIICTKRNESNTNYVRSYEVIQSLGINPYELMIFFNESQGWKIVNHRHYEIFSIIMENMKSLNLHPFVNNKLYGNEIPIQTIFEIPSLFSPPENDDIKVYKAFNEIVESFVDLMDEKIKGNATFETAVKEMKLNSLYCSLINSADSLEIPNLLPTLIDGKKILNMFNNPSLNSNSEFDQILRKLNTIIFKNSANQFYKANETALNQLNKRINPEKNYEKPKLNRIESIKNKNIQFNTPKKKKSLNKPNLNNEIIDIPYEENKPKKSFKLIPDFITVNKEELTKAQFEFEQKRKANIIPKPESEDFDDISSCSDFEEPQALTFDVVRPYEQRMNNSYQNYLYPSNYYPTYTQDYHNGFPIPYMSNSLDSNYYQHPNFGYHQYPSDYSSPNCSSVNKIETSPSINVKIINKDKSKTKKNPYKYLFNGYSDSLKQLENGDIKRNNLDNLKKLLEELRNECEFEEEESKYVLNSYIKELNNKELKPNSLHNALGLVKWFEDYTNKNKNLNNIKIPDEFKKTRLNGEIIKLNANDTGETIGNQLEQLKNSIKTTGTLAELINE